MIKTRWAQTVAADTGISLALLVLSVPAPVICIVALAVSFVAGLVVAVLLVGGLITVSGALGAVLNVALYRYATDGLARGGFSAADLDRCFRGRRSR